MIIHMTFSIMLFRDDLFKQNKNTNVDQLCLQI